MHKPPTPTPVLTCRQRLLLCLANARKLARGWRNEDAGDCFTLHYRYRWESGRRNDFVSAWMPQKWRTDVPQTHKFQGVNDLELIGKAKAMLAEAECWFRQCFGDLGEKHGPAPRIAVILWDPLVPLPGLDAGHDDSRQCCDPLTCAPEPQIKCGPPDDPRTFILLPTANQEKWGKAFEDWFLSCVVHEAWHALLWRWIGEQSPEDYEAWEEAFAVFLESQLVPGGEGFLDYATRWLCRGRDGLASMKCAADGYVEFAFIAFLHAAVTRKDPTDGGKWIGEFWRELTVGPNPFSLPLPTLEAVLRTRGLKLADVFAQYCGDSWFTGHSNHLGGGSIDTFNLIFKNFGRRIPVATLDLACQKSVSRAKRLLHTPVKGHDEVLLGYAVRYYHFFLTDLATSIELDVPDGGLSPSIMVQAFGETEDGACVTLAAGAVTKSTGAITTFRVYLPARWTYAGREVTRATVMISRADEGPVKVTYVVRL